MHGTVWLDRVSSKTQLTGLIRAGVNLGRFGDADKPGVIAALVLDGGFQPLKGVLLRAQPGGDGRNVLPPFDCSC